MITVENISKVYSLGSIGFNTFWKDCLRYGGKLGLPCPPPKCTNLFTALDNISFKVEEGEVLGIVGANGAGKSTLLKILSRITEPSSGKATLRGRVASLLEVGTGFHGDMTGRENVFLNGALYGLTRSEIGKKLDSIIDFAEIERFIDTPVKRYSSGMYVRLAFAVAVHLEPEILIIDEILAVGDVGFKNKCTKKLDELKNEGRTALFVSHNHELIQRLCPRSILLKEGKLIHDGPSIEVLQKHINKNNSKSSRDLSKCEYLYSSSDAKFTKISVINKRKTNKNEFLLGENLKFKVEAIVNNKINSGMFSLGIYKENGSAVAWSFSYDDIGRFTNFDLGINKIQFSIDPILLPGKYQLNIALCRDNGETICAIENAISFSISRLATKGRVDYNWTKTHAHCNAKTNWSFSNEI